MVTEIALFESTDLTPSRIQEREDQLRRTTCDRRIQAAKYIQVEVEFSYIYSELQLILSFMCENLSF